MGPVGRIPSGKPSVDAIENVEGGDGVPDEPANAAPRVEQVAFTLPGDAARLLGRVDSQKVALPGPMGRDVPDAVNVSTGRFGVITRNTPAQVIQTAGAAPCVIVVLYDRINGVAAMAHFHPNQDPVRSVDAMVAAARTAGLDPARTIAHVAGGRDDAPELPARILAALAPHRFGLGARDLLGLEVRAVQFHLRNGRIENYVETGNDRPPAANDGRVADLEAHPRGWRP